MENCLETFKCFVCKEIPDSDVYICSNGHIYCPSCAEETDHICRCSCDLNESQNPLVSQLQNVNSNCFFKNNGCTWKFSLKDLHNHAKECQFRPYTCIGNTLRVWECSWQGLQYELRNHFENCHEKESPMLSHDGKGTFHFPQNFNEYDKIKQINIINAFNKTFVLYYEINSELRSINIIIYLLGRTQCANKYFYEFEIQNSKEERTHKMKFTQNLYTDIEDIPKLIKTGKCISVSFRVIKNYVQDDKIKYRFKMLKNKLFGRKN